MSDFERAQAAFKRASLLRSKGQSAEALSTIREAEGLVADTDVLLRVRIATERAILEMMTGSPERAITALNWVLAEANSDRVDALLEASPNLDWHIARGFIVFVDAGLRLNHVHAAKLLDAVEQGEAFLKRIGREEWRDGLLDLRAKILCDTGELEAAVPLMRSAIELSRTSGNDSPGLSFASYQRSLARILRDLERNDEARVALEDLISDPTISKLDRLGAHNILGHMSAETGDFQSTLRHATIATQLASGMFDKQRAIVAGLMFEAHRGLKDWESARATARDELALARRAGVASIICGALQDCIDISLHFEDLEQGEKMLSEAEALAAEVDGRTDLTVYTDRIEKRRAEFEKLKRSTMLD